MLMCYRYSRIMKVRAAIRIMIIMFAGISTYDLKCPHVSQWHLRAIHSCLDDQLYVCLLEQLYGKRQFKEKCSGSAKSSTGSKLEFQPYFNLVNCDLKNYQPFTFSTIYNSDCAFLKSKCNEEGQFKFQNGDFSSDTQCGCDYTKGYIFIRQPINTCFCVPSEEDCSCHKSNCRRVLSDYTCVTEDAVPVASKCSNKHTKLVPVKNDTIISSELLFNAYSGENGYNLPIVSGIITYVFLFVIIWCIHSFELQEKKPVMTSDKPMTEDDERLYSELIQNGDVVERNFFQVTIIGEKNADKTCLIEQLLLETPVDITKVQNNATEDIHRTKCKLSVKNGSWLSCNNESERENVQMLQKAFENRQNGSQTNFSVDETYSKILRTNARSSDMPLQNISRQQNGQIDSVTHDGTQLVNGKHTLSQPSWNDLENKEQDVDIENQDPDVCCIEKFQTLLENVHSNFLESVENENFETYNSDNVSFHLWNFAHDTGYNDFCSTYQTCLSSCAVYLLVVNALDGIISKESRSYIECWFNVIQCFCSTLKNSKDKGENSMTQNPPVIAVFTNMDCTEEQKTKLRTEMCDISRNASTDDKGHLRQIFFCSTTSDSNKSTIYELRKEISKHAKSLPGWGVKVPVRWVILEEFLQKLKANGTFIIPFQDLSAIAKDKRISISNHKELVLFLHFHHEVGNIIYFADNELEDYVILDPNWLVQTFRYFIRNKKNLSVGTMTKTDFKKMQVTGEMSDSIISKLLSKDKNVATHESYLIQIMKRFDILMPYKNKELNDVLYMPLMIQGTSWEQLCSYSHTEKNRKTSWLCFEFNFLPPAFFSHILCIFMTRYQISSYMMEDTEMSAIGRDFGLFDLDSSSREQVVLRTSKKSIAMQMWTLTDKNTIPFTESINLMQSLQCCISDVSKKNRLQVEYNLYLKCPDGDFTKSGKKTFLELKNIPQYRCLEHNIMHNTHDVYLPWYSDKIDQIRPCPLNKEASEERQPEDLNGTTHH